jgi:hypothetical protein
MFLQIHSAETGSIPGWCLFEQDCNFFDWKQIGFWWGSGGEEFLGEAAS